MGVVDSLNSLVMNGIRLLAAKKVGSLATVTPVPDFGVLDLPIATPGKQHYDIPTKRIAEIMQKCTLVSTQEILTIIKSNQKTAFPT